MIFATMPFRDLPSSTDSEKSGERFLPHQDRSASLGSKSLPETASTSIATELPILINPDDKDRSDHPKTDSSSSADTVSTVSTVAQPTSPLPILTDPMNEDSDDDGSFVANSELSSFSLDQSSFSRVAHPSFEEVEESLSPLSDITNPIEEDSDESRWMDNDSSTLANSEFSFSKVVHHVFGGDRVDLFRKEEEQDQPVRTASTAPVTSQIPLTQPDAVNTNGI